MSGMKRDKSDARQMWLEHMPTGGGPMQRTPLEKGRLTIGRCESADLQIDSTRVSREHAAIDIVGNTAILKDLGSTNGTFINGEPIDEYELHDGDVIVVADTDITFLTNSTSRLRRMATQPLPQGANKAVDQRRVGKDTRSTIQHERESVYAARASHEQLLQRATPVRLLPIVDVAARRVFAQVAAPWETCGINNLASPYTAPPSHVTMRRLQTERMAAVHHCGSSQFYSRLVVHFETWEISECESLLWHAEELQLTAPPDLQLIAAVSANDAVDLTEASEYCRQLKSLNWGLALRNFASGPSHIANFEAFDPEMLFLSAELTGDLTDKPRMQRQLSLTVEACQEANIQPVVSDEHDPATIQRLVEEGVSLFLDPADFGADVLKQSVARDAVFATSN